MSYPLSLLRRTLVPALAALVLLAYPAIAQTTPDVIQQITAAIGLKPRFELRATREVDNAAAVIYNGRRYLFYNPDFLNDVNRAGHTDWAGISILAHEMGHHLNGHTLRTGGSQPADELEADEFSGFVLRHMGASLAQAQAAMATVPDGGGSLTHPGRTPRLAAISQGWQRASAQLVASSRTAAPSAAPAIVVHSAVGSQEDLASAVAVANRAAVPEELLGQLTFRNKPDQRYYLTSSLDIVRFDEDDQPEVVGRARRTSSRAFPFILTDSHQQKLFVTPRGDVYDKEGQRVAKLHDPS